MAKSSVVTAVGLALALVAVGLFLASPLLVAALWWLGAVSFEVVVIALLVAILYTQ